MTDPLVENRRKMIAAAVIIPNNIIEMLTSIAEIDVLLEDKRYADNKQWELHRAQMVRSKAEALASVVQQVRALGTVMDTLHRENSPDSSEGQAGAEKPAN